MLFLPKVSDRVGPRQCAPCAGLERSRTQVMLRSGFKGIRQTKALGFGPKGPFACEADAVAAGKEWVQAERARQGL